jgi:hypothetical protein
VNRSIIDSSLCLWSGGVHACSIQIVPSIVSHLDQVACSNVVDPDCGVLHHWGCKTGEELDVVVVTISYQLS